MLFLFFILGDGGPDVGKLRNLRDEEIGYMAQVDMAFVTSGVEADLLANYSATYLRNVQLVSNIYEVEREFSEISCQSRHGALFVGEFVLNKSL